MKRVFLVCLWPFLGNAQGVQEHLSAYNLTSITYKHSPHWSAYAEVQMRAVEDFSTPDYYEIKAGPVYHFNKNHQVLLGFGRYGTYKNESFSQREYRLWVQYTLSHKIENIKLDHRIKAEKRYFYAPKTATYSNGERYCYRLSASLPLNKDKMEQGTLYTNAYNELILAPKNGDQLLKQNWLYAGFGYQLERFANVNLGYIWQRDFSQLKGNNTHHFLYFALNFTVERGKKVRK